MKWLKNGILLTIGISFLMACGHTEPLLKRHWPIKPAISASVLFQAWQPAEYQVADFDGSTTLVVAFQHFWVQGPDGKTYAISEAHYPTASNKTGGDKSAQFNAQVLHCSSEVALLVTPSSHQANQLRMQASQSKEQVQAVLAQLQVSSVTSVGKGCHLLVLPFEASLHK